MMSVAGSRRNSFQMVALGTLILAGCAVAPPTGPTVAVMPGPHKTLAQFQQDDATCRQFASQQTGGLAPAQAANQSAVGSAAVGTVLGAAAGALLGSASGHAGTGAAIGAGAGLLGGAAVGSGNAAQSAGDIQNRYDVAYVQCMSTQGDQVPQTAEAAPPPPPPPAYVVAAPPPPPAVVYVRPAPYGYWHPW